VLADELGPEQQAAREGLAAYEAGHYEEANAKIGRAMDLADVPTLALYAARANAKLNRWVKACELYQLAARLSPTSAADVKQLHAQYEAERELAELVARIPHLTILVDGNPAEVTELLLDGKSVPQGLVGVGQLVDPGAHELRGLRRGRSVSARFDIREREHKAITIPFPLDALPAATSTNADGGIAAMPPDSQNEYAARLGLDDVAGASLRASAGQSRSNDDAQDTMQTAGWVAVAVGGGGILLGTVTGLLAVRKRNDISDQCSNSHCPALARDDVDTYNSLRNWSSAGFIAGSIAAATGGALLLLGSKSSESPQLTLGASSIRVRGSF
jgi:tetratricopeptide (TPR) repeat protein